MRGTPLNTDSLVDPYSLTTTPLRLLRDGEQLSTATGFIYNHLGRSYLVSNWHVLSGRNPVTGQPLHKSLAIPNQLEMWLYETKMTARKAVLNICDSTDTPTWIQHRDGQKIDLAAMDLTKVGLKNQIHAVNKKTDATDLAIFPGVSVYTLGFPRGLTKQGPLPVWKRGSIASEPDHLVDNKDIILIDTATKEGMSGGPVIARSTSIYLSRETMGSKLVGVATRFLGIYSGRFGGEDEFSAQLGVIWKECLLKEMLENPNQSSFELLT